MNIAVSWLSYSEESEEERARRCNILSSYDESDVFKAVLFPWVVEMAGIFTLFIISRLPWRIDVPHSAVMFVEGVILGVLYQRTELFCNRQLGTSIYYWRHINYEVLLLVFLPGILFGDTLHVNYHLFKNSLSQTLWLAFPGMMFGTVLTAVFSFFCFPLFDWSFAFSMTFGSILGATDPVAVMSLLEEVSAPPRLQMLIGGESMLNDGSAIVFYEIFKKMYFSQLGLYDDLRLFSNSTDFGTVDHGMVTVGDGFKLFAEAAFGGAVLGIGFALVNIYLLSRLNRRFEQNDTIMQICLTITSSYLTFYVSQIICGFSGVISVVFAGIITAAFALTNVNQPRSLEIIWSTIDYLGNTLLFALGGVVWGSVVSDRNRGITGVYYAYLVGLYFALTVIRYIMFLFSYPLISKLGLKTNMKEISFMTWAGLRGSVGIALALSLDNQVNQLYSEYMHVNQTQSSDILTSATIELKCYSNITITSAANVLETFNSSYSFLNNTSDLEKNEFNSFHAENSYYHKVVPTKVNKSSVLHSNSSSSYFVNLFERKLNDENSFQNGLRNVVIARDQSTQIFFLMGGIALLTLVINGTFSSHMLKSLGLVKQSECEEENLKALLNHIQHGVIEKYCTVTVKNSFIKCNFSLVKQYVSIIREVSDEEVTETRKRVEFVNGQHKVVTIAELDEQFAEEISDVSISDQQKLHDSDTTPLSSLGINRQRIHQIVTEAVSESLEGSKSQKNVSFDSPNMSEPEFLVHQVSERILSVFLKQKDGEQLIQHHNTHAKKIHKKEGEDRKVLGNQNGSQSRGARIRWANALGKAKFDRETRHQQSLAQSQPVSNDSKGKVYQMPEELESQMSSPGFRNAAVKSPNMEARPSPQNLKDNPKRSHTKLKIALQSLSHKSFFGGQETVSKEYKLKLKQLQDMRLLYLELLKSCYWDQIKRGYLFFKFTVYSLLQSVELAKEDVKNNLEINDWQCVEDLSHSVESMVEAAVYGLITLRPRSYAEIRYQAMRLKLYRAISFHEAHSQARHEFVSNFKHDNLLSEVENIVLSESDNQVKIVEAWMATIGEEEKVVAKSQIVAAILLNFQAGCIETLREEGFLKEKHASEMFKTVSLELTELHYSAKKVAEEDHAVESLETNRRKEKTPQLT